MSRLYVIAGTDDYRRISALKEILDRETDPDFRDFNYDRLEAKGLTAHTVSSVLSTPPVMADRRVIHIDDADHLSKEVEEALIAGIDDAMDRGSDDLSIVVVYGYGKKPSKAVASRAGVVHDFGEMKWRDAQTWISSYAQSEHTIRLSTAAVQALINAIGPSDSGRLKTEIDKLVVLSKGKPITPQLIEEATGAQAGKSIWDLCDRIGERNLPESLILLEDVLSQPEFNGIRVIINLSARLTKIGLARAAMDTGAPTGQVKAKLGAPWQADKVLSQARLWNLEELDRALNHLCDADLALKTGGEDVDTLRDFVITSIARTAKT